MYPTTGGITSPGYQPKVSPLTSFGAPASFTAAATQQASDYDSIMQQYKNLATQFSQNPITAGTVSAPTIAPNTFKYQQSGDVSQSLANLSNLAATGGYSAQDIADIRARDISPIRSIYANAQAQAEQQRRLSGGYSPNFNAVLGDLARSEGQQISDVNTAANAGIAQNVAANKLQASGEYAGAAAQANAAKTAADQANANILNQIEEANAQLGTQVGEFNVGSALDAAMKNRSGILGTIQGQQSLYGTTPALTSTFGNQVMQANNAAIGMSDLNNRRLATAGAMAGNVWGS